MRPLLWTPCPVDAPLGEPPARDPETVAGFFSTYLCEEQLPVFVELVRVLAQGDTPRAEFWAAVLAFLE